jgi:hypothetical protein
MPSGTCSGGTPHIATTWLYAFDFSVIRFWEEIGWRLLLIAASMISRYFEEWFKGMNKAFVSVPWQEFPVFTFLLRIDDIYVNIHLCILYAGFFCWAGNEW